MNNPPCDADNARTFNHMARIVANYRASKALDLSFPPRNETYEFRQTLETTYRDALARQPTQTYVDLEGSVVWMQEYLRYRLNACDHAKATENVLQQIHFPSLPHEPVCRNVVLFPGQELFPPRDQSLAFLQQLEFTYQVTLRRNPIPTYVDEEGVAVWIQEFLRFRVYGCSHEQAQGRVLHSITGGGTTAACGLLPGAPTDIAAGSPPLQISPPDGTVFDVYPRVTKLEWSALAGADRYSLDIESCLVVSRTSPQPWCVEGKTYEYAHRGIRDIKTTSFTTGGFPEAGPGRWRVWGIASDGRTSPKSEWREFRHLR